MNVRAPVCLLTLAALCAGMTRLSRPPGDDIGAAARKLLDALPTDLRARCNLPFDGPERPDWHFVPRTRPGVTLGEMPQPARDASHDLLRSALSPRGLAKVDDIMSLDAILRDMEKAAGGDGASRNPLAYSFAVFGTPGDGRPWGWKVEGHHISLNFTWPSPDAAAVTPSFLGANPAEVKEGPRAGHRALAAEEDLARALLASLDPAQRSKAVISTDAPREIITLPGRSLDVGPVVGLAGSEMTEPQRRALDALIREYAGNLRPELAKEQLDRMLGGGLADIRFAWAGGAEPGRGHYYRITGPTFIIEYDNTQDHANHVHTVWHDKERDFGRDLLKEHYEHDHKHE